MEAGPDRPWNSPGSESQFDSLLSLSRPKAGKGLAFIVWGGEVREGEQKELQNGSGADLGGSRGEEAALCAG